MRGVYDDTLSEAYAADRDPYGDLIVSTGSNPTPFEYTGEPEDQNGLLHLRARYYDPNLAVFNSRDPIETANRYAYVNGDPINMVDLSGNAACSSANSAFPFNSSGIGTTSSIVLPGTGSSTFQSSNDCSEEYYTAHIEQFVFAKVGIKKASSNSGFVIT